MENKPPSAPADTTNDAAQNAAAAPAADKPADNLIRVEGVLDVDRQRGGNGQLLDLTKGGKRRPTDPFVPKELIRRFKLKDGSVIGGTAFPAEGRFPWRVRLNGDGETRITLQQGQSGSQNEPSLLGSFAVKVPPLTGGAHTIHCFIGAGNEARLLFKAVQGNKELPVRWIAPVLV